MLGRSRLTGGLTLTAAVALATFAALALGSGGATTESTVVTVAGYNGTDPSFPAEAAIVGCPQGSKPLNGGWTGEADPHVPSTSPEIFPQSVKFKGGTWKVLGVNEGSSAGELKAIERCGKELPNVHAVTKTASVAPGKTATVTATCPKGTEVLRGGYDAATPDAHAPSVFVFGARRASRREWKVSAEMPSLQPKALSSGKFSAIAYCGKGPKLKAVKSVATVAPQNAQAMSLACPAGTKVVFGSALGDVDPGSQTRGVFPSESRAQGKRHWIVGGPNFASQSSPFSGKLKGYVYCA